MMRASYCQMQRSRNQCQLLPNDGWQMVGKNAMQLSDLFLCERDEI